MQPIWRCAFDVPSLRVNTRLFSIHLRLSAYEILVKRRNTVHSAYTTHGVPRNTTHNIHTTAFNGSERNYMFRTSYPNVHSEYVSLAGCCFMCDLIPSFSVVIYLLLFLDGEAIVQREPTHSHSLVMRKHFIVVVSRLNGSGGGVRLVNPKLRDP